MRSAVLYGPRRRPRRRARPSRPSPPRPTPSSGWPPPASAARTCGPTAASTPSSSPARWGTSTSASSKTSVRTFTNSSRASSSSAPSSPPTTPARSAAPATKAPACTRELVGGAQADYVRVPLADGTLVADPRDAGARPGPQPARASDVLGTGWFGAVAAEAGPGKTVAVVGDGAVGLLAVLAAKQLGAERIIAMSRHASRQQLAREFGATDIVEQRGDDGVARIKDLTDGLGAHSVIEAVGTQESMLQAIDSTRPGGHVGYVGVSHDVTLPGEHVFFSHVHLHGGPAPVRQYLPELIELIMSRHHRPRQGLRPRAAARQGRRGVRRHGRAARHQDAPPSLTSDHPRRSP